MHPAATLSRLEDNAARGANATGIRILANKRNGNCQYLRWGGKIMASKKSTGKAKIHKVMHEHKEGKLKSGSGKKVKSRKQAVAIALSEARKSGAKIPRKKAKS
jgi:hypothetical protein